MAGDQFSTTKPNELCCRYPTVQYYVQENRAYVFLVGLDNKLDKILSNVLQMQRFQAYAHIHQKAMR